MTIAPEQIPAESLVAEINLLHDEAERHAGMAVVYAARCGEKLIKAKAAVGHGQWIPWLEANCRVSRRQASRYMRLAKEMPELIGANGTSTSHLPGMEHAIALLSATDEVKAEVQERLDAGATVTVREIKELKRAAQAERQAREQLTAELGQLQRLNQALNLNLEAASEREQRTYKELVETQEKITAIAAERSRETVEQTRHEMQAVQQRVEELRHQLEQLERDKKNAIREGVKSGLAQRQEELNQLERDIQYADASLQDYRQRLKERTGDEHENQRLNVDAEKALRELLVLGTTLNMYESGVIYPVNWELLDRIAQCAGAMTALIAQFKETHRQAEKPVAAA